MYEQEAGEVSRVVMQLEHQARLITADDGQVNHQIEEGEKEERIQFIAHERQSIPQFQRGLNDNNISRPHGVLDYFGPIEPISRILVQRGLFGVSLGPLWPGLKSILRASFHRVASFALRRKSYHRESAARSPMQSPIPGRS